MGETSRGEGSTFDDPRPTVERIAQLAGRVLNGDILLPKFQRDFVWPRHKVLGLLDSIARNYPIGSILLWQSRHELASERTIAGLSIGDRPPDYPVNYLLDGQQRLSTVCGALHWRPNEDPDSIWNIVYDLTTREFLHLHSLEEPPLNQVPLRYLSDPADFFRRLAALEDGELRNRGDALFNRFQDYMIAAVTLGDMPINDIAPIFERINSTATPLNIVDLMRAATWAPEFDLREAIDDIRASLEDRSFDTIGRKTVLRTVAAATGYGFAVDDIDRLREESPDRLASVVSEVQEAAKRAVDFLTEHIRAPHPAALPYSNQFAVLTELFRLVPSSTGDRYGAVERWFWRTTLSGYFGGWNTGQMAHDHRLVSEFSSAPAGSELDVPASLPRADIWKVSQFRSNSAISKMLALMLSYEDALDLLSGQRIDPRKSLFWGNDREFHHLFPRAYLKRVGYPAGKANSVANIVLLSAASNVKVRDRAPSEYLGDLISSVGADEVRRRLAGLLVPAEAFDAAMSDDYEGFLTSRAEALQERALELIGEQEGRSVMEADALADEVLVSDEVDVDTEGDFSHQGE